MSTSLASDNSSAFGRLIASCDRSQRYFLRAAEAISNADLRRLLTIYSQQRSRFVAELKRHLLPGGDSMHSNATLEEADLLAGCANSDDELLRWCLRVDADSLKEYRQALDSTRPSKTQFLISAQYSLMQRAHNRMQTLAAKGAECVLQRRETTRMTL